MVFSTSKEETEKAPTTVPLGYDGVHARPIRGRRLPTQSGAGSSLSSATGSSGSSLDPAYANSWTKSTVENPRAPASWYPSTITSSHEVSPDDGFSVDEYEHEQTRASNSSDMRLQKGSIARHAYGAPKSLAKDQNTEASGLGSAASNFPPNNGKREGRSAFEIFEERLANKGIRPQGSINETIKSSIPRFTGDKKSNENPTERAQPRSTVGYQARDERAYTLKRLSQAAPAHGPTLKIFDSADKVIMGEEGPKPELTPTPAPKMRPVKDNRRVVMIDELRGIAENARKRSDSRTIPNRAATSLGIHQSSGDASLEHDAIPKRSNTTARELGLKGEIVHREKSSYPCLISGEEHGNRDEDPFTEANPGWINGSSFNYQENYNASKAMDTVPIMEEGSWIAPREERRESKLKDSMSIDPVSPLSSPTARAFPERLSESEVSQYSSNACKANVVAPGYGPIQLAHPESGGSISTPNGVRGIDFGGRLTEYPPPRRSSKAIVPDYTKNGSAKNSPSNPLYLKDKSVKKSLSREFSQRQNRLGSAQGMGSVELQLDPSDCPLTQTNHAIATGLSTRAHTSSKSRTSGSKDILRNVRDFVQKRSTNVIDALLAKKRSKFLNRRSSLGSWPASPKSTGPFPHMDDVHPSHRPKKVSAKSLAAERKRRERGDGDGKDKRSNKAHRCPVERQIDRSTATAHALLARARTELDGSKRSQLLEFGRVMVDAIVQARDATIAAEEAKRAARKADFARVLAAGSVTKIMGLVGGWEEGLVPSRLADPNV